MAEQDPNPRSMNVGFRAAYSKEGRAYVYDVEDIAIVYFPYTPQVRIAGGVNYEQVAPVGGAGAHMDFASTGNATASLSIAYNRTLLANARPDGRTITPDEATEKVLEAWRALEAWRFPYELGDGTSSGEAPLLVLHVPGVLEWYCRLTQLGAVEHKRDVRGRVVHVGFDVTFTEDPDRRWTANRVATVGNFRT